MDFVVKTCEAKARPGRRVPFVAPATRPPLSPFDARDPFDLRKAVLPVFERTPSGALIGLGTAVHVDGWGGFLTAEHVVEFLRASLPQGGLTSAQMHEIDSRSCSHAVVMLGIGLVFGQVSVPTWAFAPVTEMWAVVREREDPLAALRGQPGLEVGLDVAGLQVAMPAEAYEGNLDPPKTLPVQLTGWSPNVGEKVLAFGYPELKPSAPVSDATMQLLIEDGLFAAYGTITALFPKGRDRTNPTPTFEVEADWPSGMSGGPVVNEAGQVVGLVSRSLAPDGHLGGVGYAACLPWIEEVRRIAPRVDPYNAGFRLGYAIQLDGGGVHSFWPSAQLARHHAKNVESACHVVTCSHKIGTDQYICH